MIEMPKGDILKNWKQIARFIGIHPRTAQQYAKDPVDPLPVRCKGKGCPVYTSKRAILEWVERNPV